MAVVAAVLQLRGCWWTQETDVGVWVWVWDMGVGVLGWSVSGSVVVLVVLGVHGVLLCPGLRSQDAEEPCGVARSSARSYAKIRR